MKYRLHGQMLEWQTRILSQFIASTSQTDEEGHAMLNKAVGEIRFPFGDPVEEEAEQSPTDSRRGKDPKDMTPEELDDLITNGNQTATNSESSLNKLGMLG